MKLLKNEDGFSNLIPMVLAVVVTFALLFIGTFVTGAMYSNLVAQYPAEHSRTIMQNNTIATMNTVGTNYDSALGIVQVVIIITILASAIGAIFLFTRFQ